MAPLWPPGVVELQFGIEDNGEPASFGLWLLYPSAFPWTGATAEDVLTSWVTNVQQTFLDCMHSGASFRTFRLSTMRPSLFRWEAVIAPNAGGLSGGVTLARAAGVYVQSSGGGRGSGTRIRIPGIGQDLVDPPGKLTTVGVQRLQFVADALSLWPGMLYTAGLGSVVLGTLQTRDGGQLLDPPTFDPALAVRVSMVLELMVRRAKSFRRLSPT